ncbi:hypothetical protein DY000_02059224 [Brassica cretica]|uniref:Uncharacterized protein n=1 Tax=Brassica cretica TaxID=69181 RepID=A0ABQ7ANG7_BRACR|nr:hypothetical protein DY000_02059224 [Brassica cretica]
MDRKSWTEDNGQEIMDRKTEARNELWRLIWTLRTSKKSRFPMLIRDCTRCIFLTMEKYFVSRSGGLKAHIKLVSSLYSESSLRGAVKELPWHLWISFYMELEQLPSVGKLWISPRHGVRTVTFWWGSYESAHSICASSMLMKLQVKKAMVSRHSQCPSSYAREVLGAHDKSLVVDQTLMAGCQKKGGDKEPATLRLPSSFECEARKAMVPACH